MDSRIGRAAVVVGIALVVGALALLAALAGGGGGHGRATVTFVGSDGNVLATVNASVADTPAERYRGLSGTASLPNGSGMLFVYDATGTRTYVMREMNYPLDIVFVGGDGRVTRIFRAPTEDPPYHQYTARARWVLEVPYGWAARRGVRAGTSVRVTAG